MKALISPSYGALAQVVVAEVPDPEPAPDQILLRVQAAALNPLDLRLITGEFADRFPVEHPFVIGMDAAGIVAAVGENVSRFAVGDEVVAYTHFTPGTIAEYTLVAEGPQIAHRPAGLDAVHGAALPAVSMTAEMIVEAAQLTPGDVVLIVGATGGVGSFTVQLAAQAGASVLATAVRDDGSYVAGLGAAEVIDFTKGDVAGQARRHRPDGVDVAVDLINVGPALAQTAAAIKPGGRLISTLMGPDEFDREVTTTYVRMVPLSTA